MDHAVVAGDLLRLAALLRTDPPASELHQVLCWAALLARPGAVEQLLAAGADPTERSGARSPLELAARARSPECLMLLLRAGALPRARL